MSQAVRRLVSGCVELANGRLWLPERALVLMTTRYAKLARTRATRITEHGEGADPFGPDADALGDLVVERSVALTRGVRALGSRGNTTQRWAVVARTHHTRHRAHGATGCSLRGSLASAKTAPPRRTRTWQRRHSRQGADGLARRISTCSRASRSRNGSPASRRKAGCCTPGHPSSSHPTRQSICYSMNRPSQRRTITGVVAVAWELSRPNDPVAAADVGARATRLLRFANALEGGGSAFTAATIRRSVRPEPKRRRRARGAARRLRSGWAVRADTRRRRPAGGRRA